MKKSNFGKINIVILYLIMGLFLFLGCKKESPCKSVVQGDFILVE